MTSKTLLHRFALGFTLMLGMTGTVLAQSTNGSIHGTVLDPSGALIQQAQVTISGANGFSRTIHSGDSGAFEVTDLAPGSYSISVDATGFTPALEGDVRVVSDEATQENIKLGISVNQEIEVLADAV
ncbi:MAG TPA: carboxypeptidase-like regulatory domain-containing protein [Acidobacteriaceae bacterium]|jgi:hypothetical protein